MFDQRTRDAAREHVNTEDFVSVGVGESMTFRVTHIHGARDVEGKDGNDDWVCVPIDVEVFEHVNKNGVRTVPAGFRWEPAADKVSGLVDISDRLSSKTGNPNELANHRVRVSVSEGRSKRGRVFHAYKYELVDGDAPAAPAVPARPGTSPAPAAPSSSAPPIPARPGARPVASALDQFKAQANDCGNLDELEACVRALWDAIQKEGNAQAAVPAFRDAKVAVVTRMFAAAATNADLEALWPIVSPKVQNDPAALAAVEAAYLQREAALNAPGYPTAPASATPGGIDDDIPF